MVIKSVKYIFNYISGFELSYKYNMNKKNNKKNILKRKIHKKSDSKLEKNKISFNKEKIIELDYHSSNYNKCNNISIVDLANKLSIKSSYLITYLNRLGKNLKINGTIDNKTSNLIIRDLGYKFLNQNTTSKKKYLYESKNNKIKIKKIKRAPVVTIMGHVDHGKTSLLDYIRKTKLVKYESGGITQHIGAYSVKTKYGDVTFLDTPGHEAFAAMRSRGTKSTDIVVLLIAADDGVMPQTKESINHAKLASVPIIIAINKIDKQEYDIKKIKQDIIKHGLITEEYGGKIPILYISVKNGYGIDSLLEEISLQSELIDLESPINVPAKGVIIEGKLDKGRGPLITILLKSGTLNKGDTIISGSSFGKVRAMFNEYGKIVDKAYPSNPVEIQGLIEIPKSGDEFSVIENERKAKEIALLNKNNLRNSKLLCQKINKKDLILNKIGTDFKKKLNLIIKTDSNGSNEALCNSINKLFDNKKDISLKIVHSGVGDISESDINLAVVSKAIVIGFNINIDINIKKISLNKNIEILNYKVIYEVIDHIKYKILNFKSVKKDYEAIGVAEIRELYLSSKIGKIGGCMVINGTIKKDLSAKQLRKNKIYWEGKISSLKRFKKDVKEVKKGFECGISLTNQKDLKIGDIIEVFDKK